MAKYSNCACGSRTLLKHRILSRRWYEKRFYIECDSCHFCAKSAYTEKGAIRNWNKAMSIAKTKDGEPDDCRAEIECLLNQTGRTLEGLPERYDIVRWNRAANMPGAPLDIICHQSDVIELLVGALRDALEKPMQKPLTLEEANRASWVYFEEKDNGPIKHNIWPCVIWSRGPGYSFVDIDHLYRKMIYFKTDDYGVVWRCWASRPTDEEREAAAWEI